MRNLRFWIPPLIGVLVTPFSLFAAMASSGAGHGSYAAAMVLYPLSFLMLVLFAGARTTDAFADQIIHTISIVLILGIAILQFPFYGFVFSYARLKHLWWLTVAAGLICIHLIWIVFWLIFAGIPWLLTGT
jgi:hypothetical protein